MHLQLHELSERCISELPFPPPWFVDCGSHTVMSRRNMSRHLRRVALRGLTVVFAIYNNYSNYSRDRGHLSGIVQVLL